MKRKVLIALMVAVVTMLSSVMPVAAATTATVTVTAVPSYVAISDNVSTWTLNGLQGSGVLAVDTFYYSKATGPDTTVFTSNIQTAECRDEITNTSTVNINLKADISNFIGGVAMNNSDDGSNTSATFGAYVCESGVDWATAVVMKTTGSDTFWTSSSAGDDIHLAFGVETQTDAWTDGASKEATITITATAS
jgi:hypothetical protein